MRQPLAILNDLSVPSPADEYDEFELEGLLASFFEMLRSARAIRRDLALTSRIGLGQLPIQADYMPLAAFVESRGGRLLESWRQVKAMRNHAPFAKAPDLNVGDFGTEFLLDGKPAEALGLAASNAQLAVSFIGSRWTNDRIALDCLWLEEVNETLSVRCDPAEATHASTLQHVEAHEAFLRALALPDRFTGSDLWTDRARQYPHLTFLPRVEGDIAPLPPLGAALKEIQARLAELEVAVAGWVLADAPFPNWASFVTPEGENRKRLCWFTDTDGERKCFHLHARFTPGAGRIHFRVHTLNGQPHSTIAYIGRKLGV